MDALCSAWNQLTPERLQTLTGYPYLNQVNFWRTVMRMSFVHRMEANPLVYDNQYYADNPFAYYLEN